MSARIVAQGSQVLPTASRLMPLMQPVRGSTSLGAVYNIEPGTVDQPQGLVILGQASSEVYYVHAGAVNALPTPQFLQGYLIGQVTSAVYQRTAWIIPTSRIAMAFGMGMAIGYVGAVAVAASIIVLLGRFLAFVNGHPNEVGILRQHVPPAVRALLWFRAHCPVLYGKLASVLHAGVRQAIESAPSGITAEDVAAVLGRLLGGLAGAPETGFRVLAGIVVRALAVYTALHLPLIAGHGAAQHADEIARALADELRRQGASLTPAEQQAIARELARSAGAIQQLQTLSQSLAQVAPAIDRLAADFQRSGR
jgi:hypothetical protein